MKKILASILALAAFASCTKEIDNNVIANATKLVAPIEVSVAESRVFDADLNWSWENTDAIFAYQEATERFANILTLNSEGYFFNNAFEYATDAPASFHFIYPLSSLTENGLTVNQTGKWLPVLHGVAENTIISEIGTVEMNYLSSAFEVRVWESGRAARKVVTKAVISSENDFVPFWDMTTYAQTLSGKELSLELEGDTAIFNLGEGDFVFTLTLTDTEGEILSWELPSKNFVAGKRTILNVEWVAPVAAEASVTSWYEDYANNKNTALEGGAIYVTAVGGEPVVTVNGETKEVVDGKVAVASGSHSVVVTINGQEVVNRTIVVTSIPTVSATIQSSYSKNGSVEKTNNINGTELQVTASLSDDYVAKNLVSTAQAVYGSTTSNISLGSTSKFSLALGQHNCYAKVTLANGYVCQSETYAAYITGIPYTMNISANDGWSVDGNVKWGDSSSVRMGYNVDSIGDWTTETVTIERSFYLPSNVSVVAKCSGSANGSKFIFSQYSTTFTFSVSGTTVGSTESGKNSSKSFDYNSTVTMTSANPTVKCVNSTSTNKTCSRINGLSINYAI